MDENPYKAPQADKTPKERGTPWYGLSRFDDPDSDLPSLGSVLLLIPVIAAIWLCLYLSGVVR